MNWKKALMFGVIVWVVIFVIAFIFMAFGMVSGSTTFELIVSVLALVAVYVAARYIAPASSSLAVQYGLVFAIVGVILDFIITTRFAPDIFSSVYYWISMVLVVLVPMLAVKKKLVQD